MEPPRTAAQFWDREIVEPTHTSWMEHPLVRRYILRSIEPSTEWGLWPTEWFEAWLGGRRFDRVLSIGCGTGAFERDLVRRGLARRVDAFDGSTNSLRVARQTAVAEGLAARIGYFAFDFNRGIPTRGRFDAVFIHQALHHVENLEVLLRAVLVTLAPDGFLYLDEYIGPSRTDWSDALIAPQRAIFDALPPAERRVERFDLPIQPDDPSEAVRSSEILRALEIGFHTAAVRPYGGNLLSVLYPYLQASEETVRRLIDEEKKWLAAGASPFYAVIVARPRRGIAKWLAWWRYRRAIRKRLFG